MTHKRLLLAALVLAALVSAIIPIGAARAGTIDPTTFEATLDVGESVTLRKTVVIADAPATSLLDLMFVFDTSGDMIGSIDLAQATASFILSGFRGFRGLNSGVVEFKDFPEAPFGLAGDTPHTEVLALQGTDATTDAAIGGLATGGGGDSPESGLHSIFTTADETAWRDDSTRVIVAFGSAPWHEKDNPLLTAPGYPGDATTTSTVAKLVEKNVNFIGVDYGSGIGFPPAGIDSAGQASALAGAVGGGVFDGRDGPRDQDGDASRDVLNAVTDLVTRNFAEYLTVSLSAPGALPGVGFSSTCVSADPGLDSLGACVGDSAVGSYDRSLDRTFEFDVTFTGLTPGVHVFDTLALVDGGAVARELDTITVRDASVPAPAPAALAIVALVFLGLRRRVFG